MVSAPAKIARAVFFAAARGALWGSGVGEGQCCPKTMIRKGWKLPHKLDEVRLDLPSYCLASSGCRKIRLNINPQFSVVDLKTRFFRDGGKLRYSLLLQPTCLSSADRKLSPRWGPKQKGVKNARRRPMYRGPRDLPHLNAAGPEARPLHKVQALFLISVANTAPAELSSFLRQSVIFGSYSLRAYTL